MLIRMFLRHLPGLRGREEHGLSMCGQVIYDGIHGLGKPHIQYTICLIQHCKWIAKLCNK